MSSLSPALHAGGEKCRKGERLSAAQPTSGGRSSGMRVREKPKGALPARQQESPGGIRGLMRQGSLGGLLPGCILLWRCSDCDGLLGFFDGGRGFGFF